jgi:hypothetical protein
VVCIAVIGIHRTAEGSSVQELKRAKNKDNNKDKANRIAQTYLARCNREQVRQHIFRPIVKAEKTGKLLLQQQRDFFGVHEEDVL